MSFLTYARPPAKCSPGSLVSARASTAAIVRRIAVFSALAVGGFGLSAPAASAGSSEGIETERGSVGFYDSGELLRALDLRSGDGHRVRASLEWTEGGDRRVADVTDEHPCGSRLK